MAATRDSKIAYGYTPTEKDFRDMELLQQRFGVELPPQLKPTLEECNHEPQG